MMNPLIIGEAPSKSGDRYWEFPLSGAVGQRLCTWAGLEPEPRGTRYGKFYWPLRDAFDLENLIERYPGPKGVGADFPTALGRERADERMSEVDWSGRNVVLLGRRLMTAFYIPTDAPFYGWWEVEGAKLVGIPHPSGLTRNYNDPDEILKAKITLRDARERIVW